MGIPLPIALSAPASPPISLFPMTNYSAAYLPESLAAELSPAVRGCGGGGCNQSENEQLSGLNLVTRAVTQSDEERAGRCEEAGEMKVSDELRKR